ncbi:hypothetical protein O9992_20185 [Vibrio lentus]|nr:hypothetical protein [Vibrio lentus]
MMVRERTRGSRWTACSVRRISATLPRSASRQLKGCIEVAVPHGFTPSQLRISVVYRQVDGVPLHYYWRNHHVEQLKENVAAFSKPLSEEILYRYQHGV